MIVDVFIPCFIDQIYPGTAQNMIRILEKVGCNVNYNPAQTCCGQPAFNAGFRKEARDVAEKFILDFLTDRPIVCPSASCTGMVKNYYSQMFYNTSLHNEYKQVQKNMIEFSDFLVNVLKVTDLGAELRSTATYHDSCSALRECNVKDSPRELLKKVKGLEIREMEDTETCCGFGGTFAVKYESIAVAMTDQKIAKAIDVGAKIIVSTDISCLMHMESYSKAQNKNIRFMHLADVLVQGW
jgi:L-lactate dehydrogenase complex protein LldE